MKIASKTRKIEKVCTIASEAEMGYGSKMACRRLAETKKSNLALLTWAQKAKLEARNIETSLVNLKMLKESLPEIRSMTTMGGSILLQAKPS